jgi:hypothetical protein
MQRKNILIIAALSDMFVIGPNLSAEEFAVPICTFMADCTRSRAR